MLYTGTPCIDIMSCVYIILYQYNYIDIKIDVFLFLSSSIN